MTYRPKQERMSQLALIVADAKAHPSRCVVCKRPSAERRQLDLRDFQGTGEHDMLVDVPMCDACLGAVVGMTGVVLTAKARRS